MRIGAGAFHPLCASGSPGKIILLPAPLLQDLDSVGLGIRP